jgi:hypothetical protein
MSAPKLLKFLEKLHLEMSRKSSDYRAETANKRLHVFTLNVNTITNQTIRQLKRHNLDITPERVEILKGYAQHFYKQVRSNVQALDKAELNTYQTYYKSDHFRAVFLQSEGTADIYQRVRDTYKDQLTTYYDNVFNQVSQWFKNNKKDLGSLESFGEKKFLQLGHKDPEVLGSSMDAAWKNTVSDLGSPPYIRTGIKPLITEFQALRQTEAETMKVTLESAYINMSKGGKAGSRKRELLKALANAIASLKTELAYTQGSDSFVEAKRKKAINAAVDPFKKVKGAKITKENTKIKTSNSKVSKKIKSKITPVTTNFGSYRSPTTGRFISKEQAQSPINLLAIINARLHGVLEKNMHPPALQYRTGRFAQSVEAVDIQTTPKGFPSVGYTYMKYPYQTFEPGFAMGSVHRDPRKLIDKSIREIAQNIVQTQVFTRRL